MSALKKPLTLVSLLLATTGLILSAYLTYVHINPDALVCSGDGCSTVQLSSYSEMFGIPIAVFGLLLFLTLIALIVMREIREDWAETISTLIVVILVAAVLYWAYLTYLEAYVIYAFCQWCVATSIVTIILLAVEGSRWYKGYKNIGLE